MTAAVNRRLASHGFARQISALGRAGRAADAAERVVAAVWRDLLAVLATANVHNIPTIYHRILSIMQPLGHRLLATMAADVHATANWAYGAAADSLSDHLTQPYLKAIARESVMVREDFPRDSAGIVKLGVDAHAAARIVNMAGPLDNPDLTDDQKRRLFKDLIFPPPPKATVDQVVYGSGWANRIAQQTGLAAPHVVASTIAHGIAAGRSIVDQARDLLPQMNGVRASARRVAHDENMLAAHQMQQAAFDELGDMVTGYQIHGVLDNRIRPAHRARSGTTYYKNPSARQGQLGMDKCPHPPHEADGSWAYNCRCFLTPVLGNLPEVPVLNAGELDPGETSRWFADAPVRDRVLAVGADRYDFVRAALGRAPTWMDFLDAAGRLIDMAELSQKFAA